MRLCRISAQSGFSIIDQMVTLSIVSLALGAALPNFNSLRERRSLEGAAGQLESELQYAKSLAVERNQAVRFTFETAANGMCYVIHSGGPKDCHCAGSAGASCISGTQIFRSAQPDDKTGISVKSNSRSFAFDPTSGTVTPTATIELRNRQGDALRLIINIMGRVRSCSLGGTLPGQLSC